MAWYIISLDSLNQASHRTQLEAMNSSSTRYPLAIGIIVSLLFHGLGLNLSAPNRSVKGKQPQPVYVEVLPEKPQVLPVEKVPSELKREAVIPQQPEAPPKTVQRQGALDQQVEKEQALQGDAIEDSAPKVTPPPPTQPKQEQPQPVARVAREPVEAPTANQPIAQPEELPTLKELLQSATNVAADIGREEQIKHRPNIESGDETLLNMRQDKLFSFFNRFKKGIYSVWNYPKEAIDQGQQGVVLIKIIINRDGTVDDVEVLSGAQHERLNREAIAAIFKGQPYGSLPDTFEEDQLTIHAFFEYILGQSKPRIYRQ